MYKVKNKVLFGSVLLCLYSSSVRGREDYDHRSPEDESLRVGVHGGLLCLSSLSLLEDNPWVLCDPGI